MERIFALLLATARFRKATAAKPVMKITRRSGISMVRPAREFNPVHAGHDDIGDEQVELAVRDERQGLESIDHRRHLVPDTLERARQEDAQ